MIKLPTILFLISFSMLAVIHVIALELFLYWSISWFDIPVHFLGGSVVALGLFTLHDLRIYVKSRHLRPVPVVFIVLLVALAWEVFEIAAGVPIEANYVIDTLTDISMGILGGLVGYSVGTNVNKL
mgnify:FL=1